MLSKDSTLPWLIDQPEQVVRIAWGGDEVEMLVERFGLVILGVNRESPYACDSGCRERTKHRVASRTPRTDAYPSGDPQTPDGVQEPDPGSDQPLRIERQRSKREGLVQWPWAGSIEHVDHGVAGLWRCTSSLELLPIGTKTELGEALVKRVRSGDA